MNSKAISIDPKSKTNFGGKRSLIVLQKGMKKIMLSHGGKVSKYFFLQLFKSQKIKNLEKQVPLNLKLIFIIIVIISKCT